MTKALNKNDTSHTFCYPRFFLRNPHRLEAPSKIPTPSRLTPTYPPKVTDESWEWDPEKPDEPFDTASQVSGLKKQKTSFSFPVFYGCFRAQKPCFWLGLNGRWEVGREYGVVSPESNLKELDVVPEKSNKTWGRDLKV